MFGRPTRDRRTGLLHPPNILVDRRMKLTPKQLEIRATNGGGTVRHGNRRSRDTPILVFTMFPPIRGANILQDHALKYIRAVPARGSFADGASQDTKETLRTAPSCRAPDYRRLLEQEKPRSSGRPVRCGFHPTYPGWTSSKRSARRGATLRRLCDRFPGFSFDD